MPTLVIKGKITKGYNHWVKVYDEAEDLRNSKYGIKTVYRGHELEDPNKIKEQVNRVQSILDKLKINGSSSELASLSLNKFL